MLCALLILSFSSQPAVQSDALSSPLTHSVVEKIPEYQNLSLSEQALFFDKVHKLIRSFAHVALFLILGFCASMLARSYALKQWCSVVLLSCVAFSVLDESLQYVLKMGRTFQFQDLIKDWTGSLLGVLIVVLAGRIVRRCRVGGQNDGVSGSGAGQSN